MFLFVWVIIAIILLSIDVFALEYNSSCVNGVMTQNATFTLNNQPISIYQNISCAFGCSLNGIECDRLVEPGVIVTSAFPYIVIAIALLIIGFLFRDKPEFALLFIGVGIIMIILSASIMATINTLRISQLATLSQNAQITLIYALTLTIILSIIFVLYELWTNVWQKSGVV